MNTEKGHGFPFVASELYQAWRRLDYRALIMLNELPKRISRMKWRISLLVSAVVFAGGALLIAYSVIWPSPRNRSEYFRRGLERYNNGDYSSAIEDLTRAIDLTPPSDLDSAESAYSARGIAFIAAGKPLEGVSDLSRAIELKPGEPQNYAFRATGYRLLGQYEKVLEDWRRRLALLPGDRQALEEEIYVLCDLKRYDEAYACASKLAKHDPGDALANFFPGYVCTQQGRYDEAIRWLSKSIELKRDFAYAYFTRGYCNFRQGNLANAGSDRHTAVSLDSSLEREQYQAEAKPRKLPRVRTDGKDGKRREGERSK